MVFFFPTFYFSEQTKGSVLSNVNNRAQKETKLFFFKHLISWSLFSCTLRCAPAFFKYFLKQKKTTVFSQLVVSNYKGTLDVGVAFQLLLHVLPVRRGIIMSVDPTTKAPLVWYQNNNKRGHGEAQVLIGIYHGFANDEIPNLTITPVPGVFESWLRRIPAQVRIACGSIRGRPGPKVGARAMSNINIHPDSSPGCSPPQPLPPQPVPSMMWHLAQVRFVLDKMDKKLDVILHELEKLEKA